MPDASPPKTVLQRLHVLVGVALGAAALVAVVVVLGTSSSSSSGPATLRAGRPVPGAAEARRLLDGIPQRGIRLGAAAAPLMLVEFADLQCPFCRDFSRDELPGLIRSFVRPGRLQMLFRAVPALGPDSLRGARAAAGAGTVGRLWQFVEVFYANQGPENSGYATDGFLRQIARGAGVSLAFGDPDIASTRTLVHRNHITTTPSFMLGRTGGPLRLVGRGELRGAIERLLR